jgi:hypothetical protein
MIIITLFLALFQSICAPPLREVVICQPEQINPYEAIWKATCKVESDNNPFAIGDRNLKKKSYGIIQIRESRLKDYYEKTGIRYSVTDMFDVKKSKEVFMFYCSGSDLEPISRLWNGGPDGLEKESTLEYWNKIKAVL